MIQLKKTYSQLGNYTPIGNSTIHAIGCLTCDAAMVATYFGHDIDPSTLAKSVKYQGNLWIWSELTRLFPDIKYQGQVATPNDLTDAQMNQIKGLINTGYPVFLQIKTPSIPEHWLLAVDYNGDDFQVADPLKANGAIHPITDYGIAPRKVIYAYAWYTGPIAQQSTGEYYKGYDLTNKDSMKVAVDQMLKIINGEYIEKGAFEQYKKEYPVSAAEQAKKDKQTQEASDKIASDLRKEILTIQTDRAKIIEEIKNTIINNLFKTV